MDAIYFFYDMFKSENKDEMSPNDFPENCREDDENEEQSQLRKEVVKNASWQFRQLSMAYGKGIRGCGTKDTENMVSHIFSYLGKKPRPKLWPSTT